MKVIVVLIIAVVGAVAVVVGTVGGALALENQDSFCASCHTEPEVTYYQQSIQSRPATLAAFHAGKKSSCIDCHSGGGPFGRSKGLMQGWDDLTTYLSGNYRRPAITTNPLGDDSCTKCHDDIFVQRRGVRRELNGHYHAFLPRWQAADPSAARCTGCHQAHPAGSESLKYMATAPVNQVCDDCHRAMGEREER